MKVKWLVVLLIVALSLPLIPAAAQPPAPAAPTPPGLPADLVEAVMLPAVADTWVNGWAQTTNYGNKAEFYVRNANTHGALLGFDLSGIPAGATVLDARLTIYPIGQVPQNGFSGAALIPWNDPHPFTVAAYQAFRGWNEMEANWLNATAADMWGGAGVSDTATDRSATPDDEVTITNIEEEVEFNVTPMVSAWVADPAANKGVYLGGSSTKSMARSFASSTFRDATKHPKLYVLYTTYPLAENGKELFGASADTWISAYQPGTNFEGRDRIKVRTGGEFESLLKFDLGSMAAAALPDGAIVAEARLKLYVPGVPRFRVIEFAAPATLLQLGKPTGKDKVKPGTNAAPGVAGGPFCVPDAFEPDDTMEQATPFVVNGIPQTHGFAPCHEFDWAKFDAVAGTTYVIETLRLGEWYDTILTLYGPDGTFIAENDDWADLDSRIVWTAPADGTYYVKVREYDSDCPPDGTWYDCSSGSYDLSIRTPGLHAYVLTKDWAVGAATWKNASASEMWELDGAYGNDDRQRPAVGTAPTIPDIGWVTVDVTGAVKRWVDGMTASADNFGLLLEAFSDTSREYAFASSEFADVTKRPELEVVYLTKPPDFTINVVATNDFHGALTARTYSWSHGDMVGGLQWIAGYYNILRNLNPGGVIALDAGDEMQGTLESNYYFGESTVAGFNALGLMGATFGNHEFDWGIKILQDRVAQATYPYVSCNIRLKSDGSRPDWVTPYTYLNVKGVKVGLIGVAEPTTGSITNPVFTGHLDFTNPAAEVNAIIDEVIAGGATVVIVDAHLGGYSPDFTDVAALANAVDPKKVDVIISGHSHSGIATKINGIPVIQSFNNGSAFGRVDLIIDPWFETVTSSAVKPTQDVYQTWYKGPMIYEGQTVVKDAAVEAVLKPYLDGVATLKNTVIGETTVPLVRNYRLESNIGDWMADAMRELDPTIDFAMTNSGGIRADVDAGPITFGELFAVAPFGNTFVKVWVTGAQLRATLEDGVTAQHGVIQQSGLRFTFDYSLPARSRIVGDVIDVSTNAPIDPAATYLILVNNFMASGGDHYGTLPLCPQVPTYVVDIDYLAAYLTAHSPIGPVIDGRTTALGTPPP